VLKHVKLKMKEYTIQSIVRVYKWDELAREDQALLQAAKDATSGSYAPYSGFRVGAAVRLGDGTVVIGSNQENAAYPSGLCAERTALFAAGTLYPDVPVSMLAIAARGTDGELLSEPCSPCGSCRQVIIESEKRAGRPIRILLYGRRCVYVIDGIAQLMPLMFSEF
jgi:cytidine deaminase